MTDDTQLPVDLPAVCRKKLTAVFDGGNQSSDDGLLLVRAADNRLGVTKRLAAVFPDRRDPTRIRHPLQQLFKTRIYSISLGYEDGNDLNRLREDPLLKIAVGRLPTTGEALCSQSTMSRLENSPSKAEAARLTGALVDQFCASFPTPPSEIILDIDDTLDRVHGGQQLSFWNAHHDERCFMPMHVYHVGSGKPVVMILRTGKTPGGIEVRTVLKHLSKRIRRHWPATKINYRHAGRVRGTTRRSLRPTRGDGMGRKQRCRLHLRLADDLRLRHAASSDEKMRSYTMLSSIGPAAGRSRAG